MATGNDIEVFNPCKQTLLGLNEEEIQYELSIRKLKIRDYSSTDLQRLESMMREEHEPWKIPTIQDVSREIKICGEKIDVCERRIAQRPMDINESAANILLHYIRRLQRVQISAVRSRTQEEIRELLIRAQQCYADTSQWLHEVSVMNNRSTLLNRSPQAQTPTLAHSTVLEENLNATIRMEDNNPEHVSPISGIVTDVITVQTVNETTLTTSSVNRSLEEPIPSGQINTPLQTTSETGRSETIVEIASDVEHGPEKVPKNLLFSLFQNLSKSHLIIKTQTQINSSRKS